MLFFGWGDLGTPARQPYFLYSTKGSADQRNQVFTLFVTRIAEEENSHDTVITIREGQGLIKVYYWSTAIQRTNMTLGMQTAGGASAKAFQVRYNEPITIASNVIRFRR